MHLEQRLSVYDERRFTERAKQRSILSGIEGERRHTAAMHQHSMGELTTKLLNLVGTVEIFSGTERPGRDASVITTANR